MHHPVHFDYAPVPARWTSRAPNTLERTFVVIPDARSSPLACAERFARLRAVNVGLRSPEATGTKMSACFKLKKLLGSP